MTSRKYKHMYGNSSTMQNWRNQLSTLSYDNRYQSLAVASPALLYNEPKLAEQERCRFRQTAQTVQFQTKNLQHSTEYRRNWKDSCKGKDSQEEIQCIV